jgi:hypothetical protein
MNPENNQPMMPVGYLRNRKGEIVSIQLIPFKEGTMIERCSKLYVVDKNGTQHRVQRVINQE